MSNINLIIDGINVTVPAGATVLEAARKAGINVPTLCYMKGVNNPGACRICVCEVKGGRVLIAACVHPAYEGMEIFTNSPKVREARKSNMELILSEHDRECLTCVRNKNCELQTLANDLNIGELPFLGERIVHEVDDASPGIVRDNNKCIQCRRCVGMCKDVQETSVIDAQNRGIFTKIGTYFDKSLDEASCIVCGQCINVCPTGALYEKDHIAKVWAALENPDLHIVVQTAPAVRVALGEEFGDPIGTRVTTKMTRSLKRLGFDKIFDTNTGADFTIMEEGTELINRIKTGGVLPQFTSCSPGWVKYLETYAPEFIPNLSSCKSPHQMIGALVKSYYAKHAGIDPAKIFVVSIMPCSAKKYEAERPEMEVNGLRDVDAVLTTRELARMIKTARINWKGLCTGKCKECDGVGCGFDEPFGSATGAGAIFGTTGGVTEASLRTVTELMTGKPLENIEFNGARGAEGIKEYTVDMDGFSLKGAVVSGMG
ncbi:MAG: [FeFe] hydrogenase, group A, partial [Defluviitaleaceae bacterium]|nr:[FeFe] hydrogenase, group A [Defluviitaleaceae bacterium]